MYSKAKIAGHPIHPMLVGFPITFYVLTFVSFLVYQNFDPSIFWYKLGYFSNYAAVASALVAAIPGFVDWAIGIPNQTAPKRRGLIHMSLNLATLALFAVNAYLIAGTWDAPLTGLGAALGLSGIGCLIVAAAGYYGWEMVSRDKVGVDMNVDQERIQERIERRQEPPQPPMFH